MDAAHSTAIEGMDRWLLRLRIIHPFPTALNTLATVVLAFVASRGQPPAGTVVRMAVVMLLIQSAIGATNDYRDRLLDARSKPWKPLAAGVLVPVTALRIGIAAAVLAALLATTLGLPGWLLAMAGLGLGLVYNVWLKRTPLSALPYLVAIPLVPVWVWTTLGAGVGAVLWLIPLGALAGLGLHLVNALADFDADNAGGAYGLAHLLGRQRALVLAWASMVAALALASALAPMVLAQPGRIVPAIGTSLALLFAGVALYRLLPPDTALRLTFGLFGVATAISGAGWLAAL